MDFFVGTSIIKAPELWEDVAEKQIVAVFNVMDVGVASSYGASSWCAESINIEIVWRHFIIGDVGVDGFAKEVNDGTAAGIADGPSFIIGEIVVRNVLIESFGDAAGGFGEASMITGGTDVEIGEPFGHVIVIAGGNYDEFLTARQSFVGDGGAHGVSVFFGRNIPTFWVGKA